LDRSPDAPKLSFDKYGVELLKSCIRGCFKAPEGRCFVVGDFSQIELRLQALIVEEDWLLDAFRAGKDVYKAAAAGIYGVDESEVTSDQRQKGKIATLALGYGAGPVGLVRGGFPVEDESAVQGVVNKWRESRPNTVRAWKMLGTLAKLMIENAGDLSFARSMACYPGGCRLDMSLDKLDKLQPGGAANLLRVCFNLCEVVVELSWPNTHTMSTGSVQYSSGLRDEQYLWGGTIFENCVQAMAARCLMSALMRCDEERLEVVGHVHDEIIVECDEADVESVKEKLRFCMELPGFNGLLKADIWSGRRYGKK
jgi:DNA polymerase